VGDYPSMQAPLRAGGRKHACGTGTREGEWWDGGESEADVGEKLVGAI